MTATCVRRQHPERVPLRLGYLLQDALFRTRVQRFPPLSARRLASSARFMLWASTPKQFNTLNSARKQSNSTNIKTTLSKPDDPQPPADSVDAVLLLKTYHEIAHPIALLSNLRLSLKPGAKTGIIDRNGNGKITASVKNVVIREAATSRIRHWLRTNSVLCRMPQWCPAGSSSPHRFFSQHCRVNPSHPLIITSIC